MRHLFWLTLLLAATAYADTYYVATDGKKENDGSRDEPWPSVEFALSKVGGGHTIVVRPGIYRGPIQIPRRYAGRRERPTVIKSEVKWKAVVIGAEYHVISNGDDCHWLVVDGFRAQGGNYDGIKLNGDHNVVRNCWVHNNKAMGIASHGKKGTVIENNLIEFNGSHVQFDHGIYASGEGLVVRNNIVRHNSSYGIHLYPRIKNSTLANNLVHGQVRGRGIIVACPEGGGKNRIVNNTIVESRSPLQIWNGNGEVVANNILVGRGETLQFNDDCRNMKVDYNLCVPKSNRQGPNGIAGDENKMDDGWVNDGRGLFWLRKYSIAIGKGSPKHAPKRDFWGRPRPADRPIDLGAFPFVPALTTDDFRKEWDYGWAYHRHGKVMPDLWFLPE